MRKIGFVVVLLTVLFPAAAALGDAGYAGAFLRNGVGARPLGMGGAFTGIAEGAEAVYYNPAGLGFVPQIMLTSGYKTLSMDRHFGYVAVTFPIRNEAAMAAGWVNAGVSDVEGRGESRQVLGEIGNNSNAFSLSFAKALDPRISLGANLRYIQEKLDNLESFTIGMDVAAIGKPYEYLSAGFIVQNLGSNYRWESSKYWSEGGTYEERFPVVIKLGAAGHFLSNRLIPAFDIETSDKGGARYRAGAEYWFVKKVIRRVEDEYEEGTYLNVEEDFRYAGLRAGLDRGKPTFGGSVFQEFGRITLGLEYAFMLGRYGTSAGHLFTFNLGF
jgi:hypothetical protein